MINTDRLTNDNGVSRLPYMSCNGNRLRGGGRGIIIICPPPRPRFTSDDRG